MNHNEWYEQKLTEAEARISDLEKERDAIKTAANHLTSRASGVICTDAAGNRFRTVFADDITALEAAIRALNPQKPQAETE